MQIIHPHHPLDDDRSSGPLLYSAYRRTEQREAELTKGREFDKPAIYEIRVKGMIDAASASYWFEGFVTTPLPNGESLLSGQVADQSALLGLLAKIRNLGLPLLSVKRMGYGEVSKGDS